MEAAMSCELKTTKSSYQHREIDGGSNKIQKSKHACIVEACEFTRKPFGGDPFQKITEITLRRRWFHSLSHCNLVYKFVLMPQAMKIPDAKAAVDKEWEKRYKLPAWQMTKVNSKREVIEEAQKEARRVHLATLKDICHLKNSELEPKFQKYKGRVVLRGDIVKGDSGSYAVFTEQGSSASQMTAAKVLDVIPSYQDVQDNQVMQYPLFLKQVDLGEPTPLLDHVHLRCTQRKCKSNKRIIDEHRKMFESQIFAGATEKLLGCEKSHAKTVAWYYDMEGHAKKCVERYCESANSGSIVKGLLSNPLEMLVHVTQWKTRHSLAGTQASTSSHKTDKSL